MKSYFLFVSIALHAAALAYPAFLPAPRPTAPVTVTILSAEGGGKGGGSGDSGGDERPPAAKAAHAPVGNGSRVNAASGEALVDNAPQAQAEAPREPSAVEPEKSRIEFAPAIAAPILTADLGGAVPVAARDANIIAIAANGSAGRSGEITTAAGSDASAGSGSSQGVSATRASDAVGRGSGRGAGSGDRGLANGSGDRSGNGTMSVVNASYDYCPRPETPEIARRNRWSGTVTLRVFIDERGKPQSLEVNRSSGFPILDQAAIENVKQRCRFHPAREGEQRIATWIRIPVVFPLPD